DTSNMRDTTYVDPFKTSAPFIVNDGDDISKAATAAQLNNGQEPGKYPDNTGYGSEGVYWYDLEEDTTGAPTSTSILPGEIHSLVLDAQGRLLIGADGGIWRANTLNGAYDFGFNGILSSTASNTAARPLTLTNLNGNLQIANTLAVALDPTDPNRIYTSLGR